MYASTPAMERHRGLADALKAEPGIEIAASVDGAWLQSVAGEKMEYIKKHGMFGAVGENCYFQSNILPAEPFLVYLHDNVAISAGVRIITHSALNTVFNHEEKTDQYLCRFGKVEIGNNVYVGARTNEGFTTACTFMTMKPYHNW